MLVVIFQLLLDKLQIIVNRDQIMATLLDVFNLHLQHLGVLPQIETEVAGCAEISDATPTDIEMGQHQKLTIHHHPPQLRDEVEATHRIIPPRQVSRERR